MSNLARTAVVATALVALAGCTAMKTRRPELAEFTLESYLPYGEELPEGIVLAASGRETGPADPEPGSVASLSSERGWAIFARVAERPFVSAAGSVHDRRFEEPRIVAFVYRRPKGAPRGELEMAAHVRHGTAQRMRVLGGPRAVVVLVQDGRADQVVSTGFDSLVDWFRFRVQGMDF